MPQRRAILATLGSGADLVARQGGQFLVIVILARLLTPADFGTVALLGIFVAFGVVLADAGLTTAVLQHEALDQADVDTAFTVSILTGALVSCVGAGLAPLLAWAFGVPRLAPVGAFMALGIAAGAVGQVQMAIQARALQFSRLLVCGLLGAVLSGAVAVVLAVQGAGVWALAVHGVLMPTLSTLLIHVSDDRRPTLRLDRGRARRLLSLGRWVLAANVVDTGFTRLQYGLVGWLFGPAALGFWQRADSTQQLTNDATSSIVGRVALPLFARSAGSPDLLRAGYRTGVRTMTAVGAPSMALMSALGAPLLVTVFGAQWQDAAPLLTVLCIAGLMWPLHAMSITLLYAASQNRMVFSIDVVKKVGAVVLLAVGASFGVTGVAWAQVAGGVLATVVNGLAVRRVVGVGLRDQLGYAAPSLLIAASVGLAVNAVSARWSPVPLVEILSLGSAGVLLYAVLALLLRTALLDVVVALRRREVSDAG